jgi:hypothetical protein
MARLLEELVGAELNSLQIMFGSHIFMFPWANGRPPQLISASTVVQGTDAFTGLPAGQRVVVGIGRDSERDGKHTFDVVWASMIDVRRP